MGEYATAAAILSSAVGTVQQHSQARAQQRASQAAHNRDVARRRLEQQQREKQQRDDTKRRQAAARARFGGRGVSSASGSADALLGGLAAETERAIADDRRLSDFGIETLRANQSAQRRQSALASRNSLFNDVAGTVTRLPNFFDDIS